MGLPHIFRVLLSLFKKLISPQCLRHCRKGPPQPRGCDKIVIGLDPGRLGFSVEDMGDLGSAVHLANAAMNEADIWRAEGGDILEASPRF